MIFDAQKIAEQLYKAERGRYMLDKISTIYPNMNMKDSYEVQKKLVQMRLADGEKLVGMKIGLTSKAMQKTIGIDVPDYGHLTDAMVLLEGQPCKMEELIQPKVEGEIVFFLKKTLKGPGITVANVYDAVDYVAPAIEIVDSRIRNWDVTVIDTIADNASCGKLIIGSQVVPITAVDMRLTGMIMEKNGELYNSGTTAEVWGNPAASVAWLANELAKYDIEMPAGSVVLSGALTASPPAMAGDNFTISFYGMGSVSVKFI